MRDEIEQEATIVALGLTGPRLAPETIDSLIVYPEYFRVDNTTCTICALVLKNGFVVVGSSAAASLENFNENFGKEAAFKNAREKIWELEGYLLKDKLSNK